MTPSAISDADYLEAAARIIFMGGLNRTVVDAKWRAFRVAFGAFDVDLVAGYGPEDLERLAQDERLIRHRAKLSAVILNAQEMQASIREHGSFHAYVLGLLDSVGLDRACGALAERFAHISVDGARHWLLATGHDIGEVSESIRAKYGPFSG